MECDTVLSLVSRKKQAGCGLQICKELGTVAGTEEVSIDGDHDHDGQAKEKGEAWDQKRQGELD